MAAKKILETLEGLGCKILGVLLSSLEQKIYESDGRKRNWKFERKNDRKEILTPFGAVEYRRRYYRNSMRAVRANKESVRTH